MTHINLGNFFNASLDSQFLIHTTYLKTPHLISIFWRSNLGITYTAGLTGIVTLASFYAQQATIQYNHNKQTGLSFYFANFNAKHSMLRELINTCISAVERLCIKIPLQFVVTNSFMDDPLFSQLSRTTVMLGKYNNNYRILSKGLLKNCIE